MSKYMQASIFTIILFMVKVTDSARSVDGLKCYNCNSAISAHRDVCGEDFGLTAANKTFIIDDCEYCSKYYFSKTKVVVRNCTLKEDGAFSFKFGCDKKEVNGTTVKICSCDDDLCNGAISRLTVLPVHLLFCLLIFIFHGFI